MLNANDVDNALLMQDQQQASIATVQDEWELFTKE